jgi:hypothetical protein
MEKSEQGKGRAEHGYRNEVSWDEGKGRQPYGNRDDAPQKRPAAEEIEAGNAGEAAVRNAEQTEDVRNAPERPGSQA